MTKPLIKWGWLRALIGLILSLMTMAFSEYVIHAVEKVIPGGGRLSFVITELLLLLMLFVILRIFVDGERHLGFSIKGQGRDLLAAVLLALAIMGSMFVVLMATGLLKVTGINLNMGQMLYWLMVLLGYSAVEEIPLRGYVLPNLARSVKPWLAVTIISVLFGLLHLGNSNVTVWGVVNCAILGGLAGMYAIARQNLWFPIVFHLFWNYFMGVIFGAPISGKTLMQPLFQVELAAPAWLSGGGFGFEGSMLLSVIAVAAGWWLHRYLKTEDRSAAL